MASAVVLHDLEAQANEAKDPKKFYSVAFKVALTVLSIASGGIFNSPLAYFHRSSHKVLVVFYVVVMLLSFALGLALLLLSVHWCSITLPASVAKKVMWISLATMHVGVGIGAYLALENKLDSCQ
ncbi:hypothetical protein J5N97_008693 [Dioscorea zingiberensis]|uniref:Uncharacterized protein n=1 Tax=Dioscorea zingiberensis TaxID=325984 RepID=A0A9D5CXY3_9LILI|nr:hypothetical protein J5N97_008693 [Dioscorea zingiberensis]